MAREIKVRAWDRHNKVWIGPYTLKQLASDDQFNYDTEVHPVSSRFEDFDWVEYTGMKDRSGKEIYEGDILTVYYSDGSALKEPAEVKFGLHHVGYDSDAVAAGPTLGFFFSPYAYGNAYDDGNHPTWMSENFTWEFPERLEVIGNIYEHPDLVPKEVS